MASALAYLHEHEIYHGRLEASNLLCRGSVIFITGFEFFRGRLSGKELFQDRTDHLFPIHVAYLDSAALDVLDLGLVYLEMIASMSSGGLVLLRKLSEFAPNASYSNRLRLLGFFFRSGFLFFQKFFDSCLRFMLAEYMSKQVTVKDVLSILILKRRFLLDDHDSCPCTPDLPGRITSEQSGWQLNCEPFRWDGTGDTNLIVTERGTLGVGSRNEVMEVVVPNYSLPMARKRFPLNRTKRLIQRDLNRIRSEVENLRSLNHEHIVQAVGCYYEPSKSSFNLLLWPAGDSDLAYFLEEACKPGSDPIIRKNHRSWIQTWFTCLSSALAYLHFSNIQHEDIKPANIIHCGAKVYFTDFGSSRRLEPSQDTSTDSPAMVTRLFSAPEVAPDNLQRQRHGSKTDVFSLGLVFVEMLTILTGRSVEAMRDFVFSGLPEHTPYHRVPKRVFSNWFESSDLGSKVFRVLGRRMLARDRQKRPSAQNVLDLVGNSTPLDAATTCVCRWVRWETGGAEEASIDDKYVDSSDEDDYIIIEDEDL